MIHTQVLTLKRLYVASDNYHEIFFNGQIKPKYDYTECHLIERVIGKEKHKNTYVMEPNKIYKCKVERTHQDDCEFCFGTRLNLHIAQAGIIILYMSLNDDCIYIKNNGTNPVYIEKDTVIAYYDYLLE